MVNKVTLVGNVGNDPEVRYVSENVPVATFSLATSESFTSKTGERVTNTEWHHIVLWRGLAKVTEQYVKKGQMLYIEGKLTYRSYEKDGQKQYFTEIVASEMRMLGKREGSVAETSTSQSSQPSGGGTTMPPAPAAPPVETFQSAADDLPF